MVDMKRPTPRVESRNRKAQQNNHIVLPLMGIRNIIKAAITTIATSKIPAIANGRSFPSISSTGFMGVTINCSIVPISFSRTMLIAVSITVTRAIIFTTTPGMKYTRLLRSGLNHTRDCAIKAGTTEGMGAPLAEDRA